MYANFLHSLVTLGFRIIIGYLIINVFFLSWIFMTVIPPLKVCILHVLFILFYNHIVKLCMQASRNLTLYEYHP